VFLVFNRRVAGGTPAILFFSNRNQPALSEDPMTTRKIKSSRAFTLTEILSAATILIIVMLSIITCRYHATLDTKRARMQMTAARLGLLLTESWRGVHGDETYDPTAHLGGDLAISTGAGPTKPADFTSLGSYTITSNDVTCYATLSYKDVQAGLRALNVIVTWTQQVKEVALLGDADKLFELTTYTIN
jgi:type II secretory pathway pseudopilin PulG